MIASFRCGSQTWFRFQGGEEGGGVGEKVLVEGGRAVGRRGSVKGLHRVGDKWYAVRKTESPPNQAGERTLKAKVHEKPCVMFLPG